MKLKNRVAIVTGASGGIGTAIARQLIGEGCAVSLADMNIDRASELCREMVREGGRAIAIHTDVTNPHSIADMIRQTVDTFGHLDVLVNNAGIIHEADSSIEMTTEEAWDATMNINLKSMFLVTKAALSELEKSGKGAIVNIASIVGLLGSFPSQLAYTASKGGVISLSRELGVALARRGVRVNVVAPGLTATQMATQLFESDEELELRRMHIPMGRMAHPEEIAAVVAFLASDDSSYMTAHVVPVDGGMISAYLTPKD